MRVLHVTNGDCAVEVLRKAGMQGDFLPWRDVLHEGPLDSSLPLSELSKIRAAFIAEAGWGALPEVEKQFRERDERLARAAADDEVVLWFEHDLYDQLQLLQVLAWLHEHPHARLSLVCEAEYLGEMVPARVKMLFEGRKPVSRETLEGASKVWKALPALPAHEIPALRFLKAALERWRAEPQRTEELILGELAGGEFEFAELFRRTQAKDEPRFLGDTVFRKRLERLEGLGRVRRVGERWALA